MNARYWIHGLNLKKHPEGGHFREVYRSEEVIKMENLPARYSCVKNFSTSIYFLLDREEVSRFHKLQSDEIWHFYYGSSITIHIINEQGTYTAHKLGRNLGEGEELQFVIPKLSWFAAEVVNKSQFSLIGCTVAPGFDFTDFTLGGREQLLTQFPEHKILIERFT